MKIPISTGSFIKSDGTAFFTRCAVPARPKAHLVVVHGMGEHSGRYQPFMEYFTQRGYAVSAFDLRGHGRSEGARGDVASFAQWVDDARALIWNFKAALATTPTILVGHSLGGLIGLNALAYHDDVDAAVISAPPLGELYLSPWKVWLGSKVAKLMPQLPVSTDIKARHLSRDEEVVKAYRSDKLVLKRVTLRAGREVVFSSAEAMPMSYLIRKPILMVQGEGDRICNAEATKQFFHNMPSTTKNLRLYEGSFHEPFTDVIKDRVFQDVDDWVSTTIALHEDGAATTWRNVDRYSDQVHHQS